MYQTLLKPALSDAKTFILDILFPKNCLSCGKEGEFICENCKLELTELKQHNCIVCQKPAIFGLTHPGCMSPQTADGLISFYDYRDEKMAKIIIAGKYYFLPEVYKNLATMLAFKIKTQHEHLLKQSVLLCPIPLHKARLRWRGFNQAQVLCEHLAQELDLKIANALIREKNTRTQKDLKKEERLKNVSDAFVLNKGSDIKNKYILLLDDVATTGATLQQAAKVLKRNGAKSVVCLTVARD